MEKAEKIIAEFKKVLNKTELLNKGKMENCLKGYTPTEVHFIEFIGNNENSNVTKLSDAFFMTSGAISKLYKKLITKGVIDSYQKPNNKKEIYFKLTDKGKAAYKIHKQLHQEFLLRDKFVFEQVTDSELELMLLFAKRYNEHLDGLIASERNAFCKEQHYLVTRQSFR